MLNSVKTLRYQYVVTAKVVPDISTTSAQTCSQTRTPEKILEIRSFSRIVALISSYQTRNSLRPSATHVTVIPLL